MSVDDGPRSFGADGDDQDSSPTTPAQAMVPKALRAGRTCDQERISLEPGKGGGEGLTAARVSAGASVAAGESQAKMLQRSDISKVVERRRGEGGADLERRVAVEGCRTQAMEPFVEEPSSRD